MFHLLPFDPEVWKSVRVADGARLESVYAVTCIVGSNPTSSDFFSRRKSAPFARMRSKLLINGER